MLFYLAINKMKKIVFILSLVLVCIFQSCSNSNSDMNIELIPVATEEKFGYIDREGKIIINPQFAQALPFSDGKALIETIGDKDAFGYIDETGKIAINAQFKNATSFSEGIAWTVKESGAPEAIDVNGKVLFKIINAEKVFNYSEGMACYCIKDKEEKKLYGYLDKEGNTVIQPQFYKAGRFVEGMAIVKNKEGQYGYINKDGKIEINYQFDEAEEFENKFAVVKSGDNYGVIGLDGKFVVNPQFSAIVLEPNGTMVIEQNGKAGWADKEGKIAINPQFDFAKRFLNNKIAPVKSGDKFGYINKEGKYEINPQFDDATPFNNGIALVKSNEKFGIIDNEGKYLVNPQFKAIDKYAMNLLLGYGLGNQSVETDYFDISGLVSTIKKNINSSSIYKISTDLTIAEINSIYNLSAEDYSYYEKSMKIIGTNFNNIADITVEINASPKTFYDFDANLKPTMITCHILLKGKGDDKAKIVFEEFKKIIERLGEKFYEGQSSINGNLFSIKSNNSILILTTNNKDGVSIFQTGHSQGLINSMQDFYENSSTSTILNENNADSAAHSPEAN